MKKSIIRYSYACLAQDGLCNHPKGSYVLADMSATVSFEQVDPSFSFSFVDFNMVSVIIDVVVSYCFLSVLFLFRVGKSQAG